jgi:hypothetical protein
MHLFLVYDRPRTQILEQREFSDEREALRERFKAERVHSGSKDIEVVVLSAESIDVIKRTHARYFESVPEMLVRMADALRSG